MKLNFRFNRHLFLGCLFPLLLAGCGKERAREHREGLQAPMKSEIEAILRPFVEGDFNKYIAHVSSCRHLPAQNLENQLTLMRQHAAERDSVMGAVVSYSVRRVDYSEGEITATAYVEFVYSRGDTVDILLPLVWEENEWWRR